MIPKSDIEQMADFFLFKGLVVLYIYSHVSTWGVRLVEDPNAEIANLMKYLRKNTKKRTKRPEKSGKTHMGSQR